MYPRHCEWRKHGKRHTCWALVEAYRTARGSRQRVVADLGELKPTEAVGGRNSERISTVWTAAWSTTRDAIRERRYFYKSPA